MKWGNRQGQQLVFHPNNNLAVSARFKDDLLDGPLIIFDRDGQLVEQRTYKEGSLISSDKKSKAAISDELDELIQLVVQDETKTQKKIKKALDDLRVIEEQYDTVLLEQMEELEALRSQLSESELKMLSVEKENARIKAQNALKEERLQRNRLLLFGALLVITIIAALSVLLFKRNIERKRTNVLLQNQKDEIHEQHEKLEEKNKEILDSITYAKRIQSAILPPARIVKEYLENSFILYKPKDIVAGDFYWLEHKDDWVFFAAADCTGHGVPGAMVSVVCVNGLNRSVREFGLTEPGQILDNTRELVIKEFEKSEEEVKDGMDIALCAINPKTGQLKFAGAQNPLWIIRNKTTELEKIEETKGDKQPIGKYAEASPFTTHSLHLNEGDAFIFLAMAILISSEAKKEKTKVSAL